MLYGGILIALRPLTALAVPSTRSFYVGLVLIVLGTGLLKPNISAIVGTLYSAKTPAATPASRSSTWGSTSARSSAPLICSWLGDPRAGRGWIDWHFGFGAAGVGMTLGLIQYVVGPQASRRGGRQAARRSIDAGAR